MLESPFNLLTGCSLRPATFLKETLVQVFSGNFCKIFKYSFYVEQLQTAYFSKEKRIIIIVIITIIIINFFYIGNHINIFCKIFVTIAILINNMLLKPMVLSQISNNFHKFQQITKQGKEMYNVRKTVINADYKYPMFCK